MTKHTCENCKFADFRFNYAPVGSGNSNFRCAKHYKIAEYGDTCPDWNERCAEDKV